MAKRRGRKTTTSEGTSVGVGEGKLLSWATEMEKEKEVSFETLKCEEQLIMESPLIIELSEEIEAAKEQVELKQEAPSKEEQRRKSWSDLFKRNRDGENGMKLGKVHDDGEVVVITKEEVEPEINFWRYSLIAYILGQNIPVNTMVNFLKFRWKGMVIPHVIKHEDGYFILRFDKQEDMEKALVKGAQFFYSNPVILRKWIDGVPKPEELTKIPIWIRLPKLPLGFWGAQTLSKIVSKIGDPVKTDELTAQRLKIEYARVLVNVDMEKELPDNIPIKCEADGYSFKQEVKYEWRPVVCKKCKKWGHKEDTCQKHVQKQWQVKKVEEDKAIDAKKDQLVIGKQTISLPVAGKSGEKGEGNGKDKGVEEWKEVNKKNKQKKDVEDEALNKLLWNLSQIKRREEGEPSKPPDI